jgi:hypothetical protein
MVIIMMMPWHKMEFDSSLQSTAACARMLGERDKKTTKKTYDTRNSLVVTDPATGLAVAGLSRGERPGSRAFQRL